MPADTDNDYHVKEVQDMIAVMQRMIKDGKAKSLSIKLWRKKIKKICDIFVIFGLR